MRKYILIVILSTPLLYAQSPLTIEKGKAHSQLGISILFYNKA
jgi:hypothetical protein